MSAYRLFYRLKGVTLIKGFTLIELMISIAIIGILASIAVPAYNTYTIKARVTELVTISSTAKLAVAEYTQSNNALPAAAALDTYQVGACTAGKPTAGAAAQVGNVVGACIGANGVVTVGGAQATGPTTLIYTPTYTASGAITWACQSCPAAAAKYAPGNCPNITACP